MIDVIFLWPGLPDYAARLIRGVIETGLNVEIIGTKPSVPIEGMERSLGQAVHWVDDKIADDISFADLGLAIPPTVFQGGYHIKFVDNLGRQARVAGARVNLMADNNWVASSRQIFLDPLRHKLRHTSRFDGVFVPGASGVKWAEKMGYKVPIATGMYGADPRNFLKGEKLSARSKTLFFVGQFIERKNVLGLVDAFISIAEDHPEWELVLCGSGPQKDQIPSHPRVDVQGFVQPTELAKKLRQARALVLPSREEHWGLVVHEAALSGMALALTDIIGAAADLARPENSVLFRAGDTASIATGLKNIMSWSEAKWDKAEICSLSIAKEFGPHRFVQGVKALLAKGQENAEA